MAETNVLNFFNQPGTAADKDDNELVLNGTVTNDSGANLKSKVITVNMADISTASSVFVAPGAAATFIGLTSIIDGAITGADAGISTEIDTVAVTDGSITIANVGSAAGIVDSATPSALNVLTADQGVEIITDGASTGTVSATFTVEFELS